MFRRWVQRRPEGEAPAANMQHRYKGKLDAAANDVQTATKKLADDLKALGKPDTESGQEVKNSIDKLSASLQNNVSKIETATKNASGISGLASAAVTASGCDDGDVRRAHLDIANDRQRQREGRSQELIRSGRCLQRSYPLALQAPCFLDARRAM